MHELQRELLEAVWAMTNPGWKADSPCVISPLPPESGTRSGNSSGVQSHSCSFRKNLVLLLQNEYFIGLCLECDKMSVFQENEGSENVVTHQGKHPFAMSLNTAALPLLLVITVGCCA